MLKMSKAGRILACSNFLNVNRSAAVVAREILKITNRRRCKRTRRMHPPSLHALRVKKGRLHPKNPRKRSEGPNSVEASEISYKLVVVECAVLRRHARNVWVPGKHVLFLQKN